MKQSAYAKARDERVADDVVEDVHLRCAAHGCPRRWSVHGERGKACSVHYWAKPEDWPFLTAQLQRADVDRAMQMALAEPAAPLTREQRRAVLAGMSQVGREPADPKAWALRMRERHQRGERLTQAEVAAYQRALPRDGWSDAEVAP